MRRNLQQEMESAFHQYFEGLHRYAYTIVKRNDVAKDIIQQVFLKLWEKKDHLEIGQSLKAYLYRAVHNQSINHITRNIQHASLPIEAFSIEASGSGMGVEVKELQSKIEAGLNKLPAQCKAVFLKKREDGKTYAAIAAELGISPKTVEAHMSKALKILREEIFDQ